MRQPLSILLLTTILVGCSYTSSVKSKLTGSVTGETGSIEVIVNTSDPTATIAKTKENPTNTPGLAIKAASPTITPAPTKDIRILHPLTGIPVEDPSLLELSPALISVSNFPVSVRPQSGLSFAPLVIETTIGEGMTRFLALYYGNYPPDEKSNVSLGSIRSGQLYFEQIRSMFDGFIVMAGASPEVAAQLNVTYFREKIDFNGIRELAENRTKKNGPPEILPTFIESVAPDGGLDGHTLEIYWSNKNRVRWTYDKNRQVYMREQDRADASGKYYPAIDKLTGEQLAFDNVVVMAAQHTWESPTLIVIDLLYIKKEPAIFFRDGKAFKVYWSSLAPLGPFKFYNEDGTSFPYKPGNSWFEIISDIGEIYEKDPGYWYVRFFTPI